jgi:hypothetical protein
MRQRLKYAHILKCLILKIYSKLFLYFTTQRLFIGFTLLAFTAWYIVFILTKCFCNKYGFVFLFDPGQFVNQSHCFIVGLVNGIATLRLRNLSKIRFLKYLNGTSLKYFSYQYVETRLADRMAAFVILLRLI